MTYDTRGKISYYATTRHCIGGGREVCRCRRKGGKTSVSTGHGTEVGEGGLGQVSVAVSLKTRGDMPYDSIDLNTWEEET